MNPYAGMAKPVQNQKQYSNIDDETPEEIELSENFRGGVRSSSRRDCCGIRSYWTGGSADGSLQRYLRRERADVPIFCALKPVAVMAYEV